MDSLDRVMALNIWWALHEKAPPGDLQQVTGKRWEHEVPDDQDLRAVFAEHSEFVVRLVSAWLAREGLSRDGAEDILQRVMIKVITGQRSRKLRLDRPGDTKQLLAKIAAGEVANERRLACNTRNQPLQPTDDVSSPGSAEDVLLVKAGWEECLSMIAMLPETLRQLIIARYETDLSMADAAAVAGIRVDRARVIWREFRNKVEHVASGGVLRGRHATSVTTFAQWAIRRQNERNRRA
ncbi:RNA polymerase sigma factor [Actinoplanes sichuanensis]|uniref:RNA polymerase sigma factor n=1 Tax=Actinoplanes sichuanensis TaxID=512349 RepID=A0ABW4A1D8_9ACTN